MLVEKHKSNISATEGFSTQSRQYRVDSPALVFDVLCNKMYSNPLSTMIQEYLANARDAHREAGNTDTPVKVTLPNELDEHLYIRDFGPGLSNQRIDDVFVSLGASTKNESDEMTGGFGLGAKIGWAYGDSFTVISVVDGVQSTYLAYLGEDGVGRMDTLSVDVTDELNGVTIKVYIKHSDRYNIKTLIEKITYFWDVPPVCLSYTFKKYEGVIDTPVLYVPVPFSTHGNIYAVVDGIPYHLNKGLIPSTQSLRLPGNLNTLFLFFDVSEVDVSINREGLRYSQKTIDNITHSITNIVSTHNEVVRNAAIIPDCVERIKVLRQCYTTLGAPADIAVPISDTIFLKMSYIDSRGRIYVMRSNSAVSTYDISHTGQVRVDIRIKLDKRGCNVPVLTEEQVEGHPIDRYNVRDIAGVSFNLNASLPYIALIDNEEDFATVFRDRCRTILSTHQQASVLVVSNKNDFDFLVNDLKCPSLNDTPETPKVKSTRSGGSKAYNFVDTDVKHVNSRMRTMHIDTLLSSDNVMWCAFKDSADVRDLQIRTFNILQDFANKNCYYLTAPQIEYIKSKQTKVPHYLEVFKTNMNQFAAYTYNTIDTSYRSISTTLHAIENIDAHGTYRSVLAFTVIKNNIDCFPSNHPIHEFLKAVALKNVFNVTIAQVLYKYENYKYILHNTCNRTSRIATYYTNLNKHVMSYTQKIIDEFTDTFPLLFMLNIRNSREVRQGTVANKQLLDYMLNAHKK